MRTPDQEALVAERCRQIGMRLRVAGPPPGKMGVRHWMFDLDGARVLNYWPTSGTCWAVGFGKRKVAGPLDALALAARIAGLDGAPLRPEDERNLERQLVEDAPEPAVADEADDPLARAIARGYLEIEPWMPAGDFPLLSAWRRHCAAAGIEPRLLESERLRAWRESRRL